MKLWTIQKALSRKLARLSFAPPVTHVYDPLSYAEVPARLYAERFGVGSREVLLVGMNPGPFGMAQTGVPFGDPASVRDFLGIEGPVGAPSPMHPKRPVLGFSCARSEVSGTRVWGWVRDRFGSAEAFFQRFYITNYCPLVFMEASGKNRTPDMLPKAEREALFAACDEALALTIDALSPRFVVGIGNFAAARARFATHDRGLLTGAILHPSPANPLANRSWAPTIERQLAELGVTIPGAGT